MNNEKFTEDQPMKSAPGMPALIANLLLTVTSIWAFIQGIVWLSGNEANQVGVIMIVTSCIWFCIFMPIIFCGLKILKPNEALVLTFFGEYKGTLRGPGFFFVNPFVSAIAPIVNKPATAAVKGDKELSAETAYAIAEAAASNKKISLKALTLSNDKQKINDLLGNPIIIGIVVVWRVVNAARAVFNVENYTEFLSIQCDSALRNIARLYPYDSNDEQSEKSLRASSSEIAQKLVQEIQEKVDIAGLQILEARITHLSYAPEIAAAMLQRQQAGAIVAARQLIVEGAVGMVEMALEKLSDKKIIELDHERKASMISNLLVVLCANRDAQPIVNSGSLY
jgi:regulator of protease activity HflC (stomatin/prohibitin superfamily)